jgi:hypothetical protein
MLQREIAALTVQNTALRVNASDKMLKSGGKKMPISGGEDVYMIVSFSV